MHAIMTPDLYWMTLSAMMTGLLWIPYVTNRIFEFGLPNLKLNPPGNAPSNIAWAARAYRAHMNALENLTVFAPLVLAIFVTGHSSPLTGYACHGYFYARFMHAGICIFGLPSLLRTLAFVGGVAAQLVLAAVLLGLM